MKYQSDVQVLSQVHLKTMDGKPSPHLKKVLKSYQLTAANTLSGPSPYLNNASSTPTPTSSSSSGSTLIIKSNYADPNGLIHGHGAKSLEDRERESYPRVKKEPDSVPPASPDEFSRNSYHIMSDSSSTSTGSTSASPVSHHGGYDGVEEVSSPQRGGEQRHDTSKQAIKIEKEFGQVQGAKVQPHPKKMLYRHSSTPTNWKDEQQRSLQAAMILASGLQHPKKLHSRELLNGGSRQFVLPTMQPPPILSAPDRSTTEKRETVLEDMLISCFVVGGEKRLCFPQILTTVLRPFTLLQINQVCDELQIFCSRCSAEQLEVLKGTGVLPTGAPSCGLITKTDAERLVNALLHRNPPKAAVGSVAARSGAAASSPNNAFRVYHKCFGKCKGIVLYNLYDRMDSLCIECVECHGLFSPARFVAHSHHRQEVRTCHWGFDSSRWRNYLLLARDEDPEKWNKTLADFKGKFDQKRKESVASDSESYGNGDDHLVIKRVRYSSGLDTPIITSPTAGHTHSVSTILVDPAALYLPKKRLSSLLQYSDNDQSHGNESEVESIKSLLIAQLGAKGAEPVIKFLDKQTTKISNLEKICRSQDHQLRRSESSQSGADNLQAKVNTMEAELHSLKKQLLRRHEQR